ncbi:MAG: hypothetical protein H6662_16055 [Ardenticatenaceae bacterium]|nr:hypothetical protein [Anaerolineales bacterium]MCB8923101.1 hypothetical protein [Ardenticatenaceae bacterium]MCB8990032.1 hypothetical protein [Ardenticatenaceae bacterium]
MKRTLTHFLFAVALSLWLLSCGGGENVSPTATPAPVDEVSVNDTAVADTTSLNESSTATTAPADTPEPPPTAEIETEPEAEATVIPTETAVPPTPTPLPPLPSDPQRIEFETEDGASRVGTYYPAAINPAPVVVLMHWAGGDQTDWQYVGMAAWLQNRGLSIPAAAGAKAFDTPYPFPPLLEGESYAVFTFDFRGFGESGGEFSQEGIILDAHAAYATASALPGVDPQRMVGIGASIGSDAVVDGCGELCQAALSLSPGSYLGVDYAEAVTLVDEEGKPVWCVAAEGDETAVTTCQSANGEQYQITIYPNGGHAMELFRVENNLQPPIEAILLDFLHEVLRD